MLLKDFISGSVSDLEALYGPDEAKSIVLMLCEALLGTRSYTHIIEPGYEIAAGKRASLDAAMQRLKEGEPLQYVLGYAHFSGFMFRVDPSVLIPRPETELLCRMSGEALDMKRRRLDAFGRKDVKVLDLCTGSGCIAWTLALSCPGCRVMGVDISEGALRTADGQDFGGEIKRTGALKPVFIREDVLALAEDGPLPDAVAGWGGFDILVSNPPYVRDSERAMMRRNVCDFEPGLALFVPDEDPLKFYRSIAVWAKLAMVDGGAGFVEINEAFGEQTAALFRGAGFRNVGAVKDFCGKNRFVRFTK